MKGVRVFTMQTNKLMQEAHQILDETQLMQILSAHGTARLVGSVALDLIVKLDIDIHVLLPHPDLFSAVSRINQSLLDLPKIREVRLTDWRSQGGLKIGVDAYPAPSGDWSFDIWVTDQIESTAFDFVPEMLEKLTPETRGVILMLKQHYYEQHLLRDGRSLKIYQAVLDAGIRTLEDFEAWHLNEFQE